MIRPELKVIHPEETGDWILEIRTSSLQDSGAYDCQVNTYPKKSTRVNLQVLSKEGSSETKYPVTSKASQASVPKAITLDIIGRGWAEVHVGKALGLTCEAHGDNLAEVHSSSRASENPLIEWTLDEVPVTLLFDKEKVEVHESWRGDLVVSQLTLYDLTIDDSGIFGCHAPHAAAQTIPVTVLRAGSTAYLESINKYARRKGFESQFPTDSWPVKKPPQNDAAETPPQPVADQHLVPSKAPACTSNKAMVISGAVMLFIMIVNSAIGIAMYCKTH
ncbi:hypothetical protein HAZT_HAZT006484 [Hyalella azteca]|uniref:Ig-like domain-containing protein n=1 Tax=Hyalella azteca TaxID=294128 RepID=A0A6A0H0B1_HYAAZ|nr:hypothetical protein HAZT_HAZT006484 [Hyalella azteca]